MKTQVCVTCGEEKTMDNYHWRSDTNKYRAQCKACHKGIKHPFNRRPFSDTEKECGKCGKVKLNKEFNKDKTTKSGLTSWCIDCKKEYQLANADTIKETRAMTLYGVTREEAKRLLAKPFCEICGVPFSEARRNIDHCHDTGKVRGVLCTTCNQGLGFFGDNIDRMRKAITYLRISKEQ